MAKKEKDFVLTYLEKQFPDKTPQAINIMLQGIKVYSQLLVRYSKDKLFMYDIITNEAGRKI